MSKQPFYHRIDGLLLTEAVDLNKGQISCLINEKIIIDILEKGLKKYGLVKNTTTIEEFHEPEAGNPSDL